MFVLVAIVALVAGLGLAVVLLRPQQPGVIAPSYAFDVSDPRQVAGFADHVFVGTVVDSRSARTGQGPPMIRHRIRVDQTLKGELGGTVDVHAHGGKTLWSEWVVSGETALLEGQTFLLAVTGSGSRLLSVGGPTAPQRIDSVAHRAEVIAYWQDAIAHQRWPDGLPR
jgi:hypothetical protein